MDAPYSKQVFTPDADFVRALRQKDAAAFEELVRAFLPRVRRLAMRCFASPFEQEDAVQEAFTHIYAHLGTVDPLRRESLAGWVVTTARHRILDLARQRRPEVPVELPEDAGEEEPKGPRVVASVELSEVLARFEEKLNPKYRAYYRAVFLDGRDWDEAREALGLSRLRAKYLKSVLLKRLQRHGPLLEALGRRDRP
ncbi:MAG: sigma-70 family RNA polymerase sigma factor [Myxococcota bacterium]